MLFHFFYLASASAAPPIPSLSLNETALNATVNVLARVAHRNMSAADAADNITALCDATDAAISYTIVPDASNVQNFRRTFCALSDGAAAGAYYMHKKAAFDSAGLWLRFSERAVVRRLRVGSVEDAPPKCYVPERVIISRRPSRPGNVTVSLDEDADLREFGKYSKLWLRFPAPKIQCLICVGNIEVEFEPQSE